MVNIHRAQPEIRPLGYLPLPQSMQQDSRIQPAAQTRQQCPLCAEHTAERGKKLLVKGGIHNRLSAVAVAHQALIATICQRLTVQLIQLFQIRQDLCFQ